MSLSQRFAIWRLRVHLRIWPWMGSDQMVATGLDNLQWRFASIGAGDDMPDVLAALGGFSPTGVRDLILKAATERVPSTWWDDEAASPSEETR